MNDTPAARRRRGLSARISLTLSYAAVAAVVGLTFFVVGLLVLRFVPEGNLSFTDGGFIPDRSDLTRVFIRYAAIALPAMMILGLLGGWVLAGRMLAPLTRITSVAAEVSRGDLAQRINLPGRTNELSELADTFDNMLDRVQQSFDGHRRFAANASHELRTPLATIRTIVDVAQADPAGRDIDQVFTRLRETNERSILLTEALLLLADAEGRPLELAPVRFDLLISTVVQEHDELIRTRRLALSTDMTETTVEGEAALLRQLTRNLLHNAIIHNVDRGTIHVTVRRRPEGVMLEIKNTGVVVDSTTVASLIDPFTRGRGRSRNPDDAGGAGLGLSIVAAIARAHSAGLEVLPRSSGGIIVRVIFRAAS